MLKTIAYCLMLFFAVDSAGQSLVKCDGGISFWVIKKKGKIFTVELKGDVSASDTPELMNVEETALHYNLLEKSKYVEKNRSNSDAAILTRFIKGEEKFLGDKMKPEYNIRKLPSGRGYLLWHHDWHGTDEYVEQQVHATIILGETIIWLSAPKFMGQEIEKIEAFLSETIAKVKIVKSADKLCEK